MYHCAVCSAGCSAVSSMTSCAASAAWLSLMAFASARMSPASSCTLFTVCMVQSLYYGRMTDPYVLRMQILSTKSVGGMDVADKVHIQVFSTNDSLAPEARVFRQTTKNGLYNALDIGSIWLQKANETR